MRAAPDLRAYRRIVVAFSGGKDSLAALLHLLAIGVPAHAIELHHHDVDGHGPSFMDWPCTPGYVRAIAAHLGLPLYFSWREGGFARELDRSAAPTAPIRFETPDGIGIAGGNGPAGTRGIFPQTAADLRVRWCSPSLKIDVLAAAIRNQARFLDGSTLVVTGERRGKPGARPLRLVRAAPHRDRDPRRRPLATRPRLDRGPGMAGNRRCRHPIPPGLRPGMGPPLVPDLHLRLARPMGDRQARLSYRLPARAGPRSGQRQDNPPRARRRAARRSRNPVPGCIPTSG
ncbi:hypothetical protein [Sphingomonas sp. ABOLF]|uniref:hypothetical protein n=1 Tax=Sphingomonas sp. ABOLF TaxID=1985879 RepID=UPI0032171F73